MGNFYRDNKDIENVIDALDLTEVATLLAEKDISIRNIGIVHNRDFEQGALGVEFYNENAQKAAVSVLKEKKYRIYET